jgi:hypothetical protein
LRQCKDIVTRIDWVRAIGPTTLSPVRSRVACVTIEVLATAEGVAANAAEPAARPTATTKAFNLRLLGIIELLLMGRSTGAPCEHATRATQIRNAHSPPGRPDRQAPLIPLHMTRRSTRRECGSPGGALTPADPTNVNKCNVAVTLHCNNAFSSETAT